ncbi:MAG TPA: sigma-70 family RNA polymerase sigma factor [Candidatus Kapabacteria bacterium]|nr:sigma-70 family RNA polymerase sigma factor [Candidatus Kapabacteria bacterium]
MSEQTQDIKIALSDEELWSTFCEGEESAYTLLYYRHADRLYSYLKMLLSASFHESIDDVFQETWVRVFQGREKFTSNGSGSFAGWLFRIAHNISVSLMRRPHTVSTFKDLASEEIVLRTASVSEYDPLSDNRSVDEVLKILRGVVEELPMQYKEVYLLAEFEHLSIDQVADATGISKGNAKVRLHRARQIVREKVLVALGVEFDGAKNNTEL